MVVIMVLRELFYIEALIKIVLMVLIFIQQIFIMEVIWILI